MIVRTQIFGAALLSLALSSPALAHHSYSMFDTEKTLVLQGTIKEFQWTNPHIWVELKVPSGPNSGDWSLEGGAISLMKRQGWSKDMLPAGTKVAITIHPVKSGAKSGSLMEIALPSGAKLLGGGRPGTQTNLNVIER